MISQQDKEILINYRIERAKDTVKAARLNLDNEMLHDSMNRIYYSIFYIVSALALKSGFSTSKHSQLMGWFIHDIINTNRIPSKYGDIYKSSFNNRQKGDYDDLIKFEKTEVEEYFKNMIEFVNEVEGLINEIC